MNFFINKAIGHGNSGVEHAQFYRAKLFEDNNDEFKYIYTNFLPDLHKHMKEWGIKEKNVINVYDFFMSQDPDTYLRNGLEMQYKDTKSQTEKIVKDFTQTHRVSKRRSSGEYDISIIKKKLFSPEKNLYLVSDDRYFLTNNNTKMTWHIEKDDIDENKIVSIHVNGFKGNYLYFENLDRMLEFFFNYINDFFKNNVYFIDRGAENEETLVRIKENGRRMKIVDIVHAGHLVEYQNSHPLWNNFYEYMFDNLASIDRVVVATNLQAYDMKNDLKRIDKSFQNKVKVIPVGGIEKIMPPKNLSNNTIKFVTASRLHVEKHIDQIIKAFWIFLEKGHSGLLYIYGAGAEQSKLERLISELDLNDKVFIKGLSQNITSDLQNFDAFVSASYSEGFGLTYLEAIGNSMPIVTYNNKYGAQELVKQDENGYLANFKIDTSSEEDNIKNLSKGMEDVFDRFNQLSLGANKKAEEYQNERIANLWKNLLEELNEN